ncbi:unnamed protein product [Mucor hiemalis]
MHRRPIKESLVDSKKRWRDKFKQECTDRMKLARQDKVNKMREEQWMQKVLESEWDRFKKQHEQAMNDEDLSVEDYEEEESEIHLPLEREVLENEIALYEELLELCVNCHKVPLQPSALKNTPIALCPSCGFYATEKCLENIKRAASEHNSNCSGNMEYALEPGTDNTLLAACNVCDLWTMFTM